MSKPGHRWLTLAVSLWIGSALLFCLLATQGTEWFLEHRLRNRPCMPPATVCWLRHFYPFWVGWAPLGWAGLLVASLAPLRLGFTNQRAALAYVLGAAWAGASALFLSGVLLLETLSPWTTTGSPAVGLVLVGPLLTAGLTPAVAVAWLKCCKKVALSPRSPAPECELLRALVLGAVPAASAVFLSSHFKIPLRALDLPFLAVPVHVAACGTGVGLCLLGVLALRARFAPPEAPLPGR
ncbi:MAG: hypothetical protein JKY65_12615 [Planctomycetes bacterium]|nr:hypothetical protein [Planctomycetota bacterium]